jgi:hypothetical protein
LRKVAPSRPNRPTVADAATTLWIATGGGSDSLQCHNQRAISQDEHEVPLIEAAEEKHGIQSIKIDHPKMALADAGS